MKPTFKRKSANFGKLQPKVPHHLPRSQDIKHKLHPIIVRADNMCQTLQWTLPIEESFPNIPLTRRDLEVRRQVRFIIQGRRNGESRTGSGGGQVWPLHQVGFFRMTDNLAHWPGPGPNFPPSYFTQNVIQSGGEQKGDLSQLLFILWFLCYNVFRINPVVRKPGGVRRSQQLQWQTPTTHMRCDPGCLWSDSRDLVEPQVMRGSSHTPTPTPQCSKTPHKKRYTGSVAESTDRRLC